MTKPVALVAAGLCVLLSTAGSGLAQSRPALSPEVQRYVRVSAPVVALTHVRVVDGTGSAPKENQTVIISGDKIQSVGDASAATVPAGAQVLDLTGYTVIPGLVGMHEHMFYPSTRVPIYNEMAYSFPKLYLAAGVTTVRTGGSLEPYTDIELKHLIDAGQMAGPEMHITGPYLEGVGAYTPQMHVLKDAEDARRTVNYWADEGATSFKAYMHITRDELAAVVDAAHKRGLKVTGHLCSIGFREAAAIGIDNLEHGLFVDTEFVPGKAPDVCPSQVDTRAGYGGARSRERASASHDSRPCRPSRGDHFHPARFSSRWCPTDRRSTRGFWTRCCPRRRWIT